VLIAQITDTHIRPKGKLLHHMVPTARYLRRCIVQLETMEHRPDVVVATGDLVDRGKPKEYRRLKKILARLSIPLFVVPGNHDDRSAFREAFDDHAYLPAHGPLQYVIDGFPLRLIGLDTTRKKHPGGELDDTRLAWLAARLDEQPRRPTFVFMHHPPFATGIAPVDRHGFRGLDRFAALVARHPQIVRIVCGHIHRPTTIPFARTVASSAPSTAPQLVVDRGASGFYGIRLEPAGFALHRLNGSTIETTLRPVEAYPTPPRPRLSAVS
jgi:3',5'-cyclic AMP phosphodiesterase CpdA